ncbi:putative nuclease HARBI1 [Photinus pyralis]|uniref:putative nuclease HARBI1 n=1 Tax=Photinus pyralis TaxID=7054 RepID=UPI001266E5F1|nr:putative nuclease HARBI1 [Photinus pyralis]
MESFRSVASRFNVSKSTCWDVLQRTAHRLLEVNRLYGIIRWPYENEALETMRTFQRRSSIPGIIGCIDGCHVKIIAPKDHPNSYVNRKKFHSVLLQGVCNEKKLFIDIYAGEPGSLHDYNLFLKSDLAELIRTQSVTFYNNGHLIGDLVYKLSTNMLIGFKNCGNINRREINFNKKLNSCRVEIENAFVLLKGRFRRLKFIETVRLDFISLFIVTAAILHNVCLLSNDLPDDIIDLNEEIREVQRNDVNEIGANEGVDNNAEQKRRNILLNLPLDE